jgi:hypothetical protein
MPDRVFTEEEVKAIIRRASVRQDEESERREARQHGLTLADLEQLGTEVGLDPKHLRAAANEVRTGRPATGDAETQTATHVVVERRIDRPFTPEAWEDTVVMLRQSFGVSQGMWFGGSGEGRVEQIGRAHEWVHMSQLGVETRISASDRDGQTRLILSQRVGQASPKVEGIAFGVFIALVVGILGGIPIAGALDSYGAFFLAFVVIALLTVLVAAPIATRVDQRWRDKKQRKLKDLAADIEQVFVDAAPRSVETTSPSDAAARDAEPESASDGRIDLDAVPDADESADSVTRNRVRS